MFSFGNIWLDAMTANNIFYMLTMLTTSIFCLNKINHMNCGFN